MELVVYADLSIVEGFAAGGRGEATHNPRHNSITKPQESDISLVGCFVQQRSQRGSTRPRRRTE